MLFKKPWQKETHDGISEVIYEYVKEDSYDRQGAVERVDARLDRLQEVVSKMAELMTPEQQKTLAEYFNFDIVG